jgi:hydrogenase nickel incorporation protein HypA/HybF
MHHGFHLAEDVLRKIKATGSTAQTFRVLVGEGLAVSETELKDAFRVIAASTPFAQAKLEIKMVPVKAACSQCRSEFAPETFRLDCPKCGSQSIKIVSGQGIEVIPFPKV